MASGSILEAPRRTFWDLCSTLGASRSTLDHFWVPRVQIGGNAEDFGGLSSTLEAFISTVGGPRWPFGDPREHFEVLVRNYGVLGKTFGALKNMLGACILGPLSPTGVPLFPNPAKLFWGLGSPKEYFGSSCKYFLGP